VDFDTAFGAVILNKTQLSEFVHEETHAGSGCANHLRQGLLADFCDYRFRLSILAKVRQEQEETGKAFLTRIEQLVDKVGFDSDGPAQKVGNEHFREGWFVMDHADDGSLVQAHDNAVDQSRNGRYALRLAGKAGFTEEFVRIKNCDDGLFTLLRNDSDLDLALLDIEERIRGGAL